MSLGFGTLRDMTVLLVTFFFDVKIITSYIASVLLLITSCSVYVAVVVVYRFDLLIIIIICVRVEIHGVQN